MFRFRFTCTYFSKRWEEVKNDETQKVGWVGTVISA